MPYYEITHHTSDGNLSSHYYLPHISNSTVTTHALFICILSKQTNLYFFDSGNYDISNYISKPEEINMNFMRNR